MSDSPMLSAQDMVAIPVGSGQPTAPAAPSASPRRERAQRFVRRHWRVLVWLLIAMAWFFTLRPAMWGGPAGYDIVAGIGMEPAFNRGDLVVTFAQPSYSTGDLIAYHVPAGNPAAGSVVVHRVVEATAAGYTTRADNASIVDPWQPSSADVIGRVWVSVPGAGAALLALKQPVVLALVLGSLAGIWWYFTFGRSTRIGRGKGRGLIAIPVRRRTLQPVPMGEPIEQPIEEPVSTASD